MTRLHLATLALLVSLASCTPVTPTQCGPTNCLGCCDSSGICQAGITDSTCGKNGSSCSSCSNGQVCTLGACTLTNNMGGGSSGGGTTAGGSAAGGDAGGSTAGGSAAGGDAGGMTAGGSTAGGSTAGGDAGGMTAGGSTAGGSTAGGSTAGGSTAGGSTAGGSTAGGATAGGSTAGGSTAGGSTAGGSTAGGSTAGGSTAGGSTAGGSTAGGAAGGSTAGGSAGGAGGGSASMVCPGSTTVCAGCCVGPLCVDFPSQNNSACGNGGNSCAPCASGTCNMGACQVVATCTAANCNGCCQGTLCVPFGGQNASQCGLGGSACTACAANNSCNSGVCSPTVACDFFSCPGCCSNGQCQAVANQSTTSCGVNGALCTSCTSGATCSSGVCSGGAVCNATTCSGCCNGTSCVAPASTSVTACGFGGNACVMCAPGQVCSAGLCVANPSSNCITITPFDVDFGTVQTGCRSAPMQFTIRNTCATSQTISALGVSGAGFSSSSVTLPQVLANGASMNFTVTFAPTTVGPVVGSLVVGATAGMTVAYQTPVFGNGATTGGNQDRFRIPTKTDVVLIVDNSCSMSTHQANLGANANAFLSYAFSANVDFNLGVTTTDFETGGEQGAFVGPTGQKVLRSTTPNLLSAFNTRVNVGVNGSAIESMMEPGLAAVSQPLITGTNVGFLRSDAALSLLAFTDAEDQSNSAVGFAEFYARLLRVKGQRRRNELSFSYVAPSMANPPTTSCTYDHVNPLPDPRTAGIISASGGILHEICSVGNASWRGDATRIGQAVFGARAVWFLTSRPSPATASSVTTTINGVTVPEMDAGGRNWTYDAMRNAVVFETRALPAPGQTVGFDYNVACMP